MGPEDKKKEKREQRGAGRKEQDHLPMAGSDKVPVTIPQKPLTDSNAIHFPTPVRRKSGSDGVQNQERQ